jgi:monovalent cation:H+ antiporter-2, CPA2 family
VLMLLFLIAMELSIRAFVTVLRTALLCALLQIGVALGLTFLLALIMNWPVKTAVLLGFIVSLSSTAVAIAGEGGMQRDADPAFVFQSAIQKAAPCGAA